VVRDHYYRLIPLTVPEPSRGLLPVTTVSKQNTQSDTHDITLKQLDTSHGVFPFCLIPIRQGLGFGLGPGLGLALGSGLGLGLWLGIGIRRNGIRRNGA